MMSNTRAASALALALGSIAATPTPAQTAIHPGDQLNIQVYGQPSLSETVTVLPDGSIEYPLLGRVQLGGQSVDTAQNTFRVKLEKYVRHPYVTIAISQLGQPSVLVLGDVKTPGKYQLRSDAKITDAIAAAGGVADINGDYPPARISDAQGNVSTVSLDKLLRSGDTSLDKPLQEGSVVYVQGPDTFNVVVTGAVDHPGDIQVAEGDKLSMAVAKAGNSAASNADLNHIRVTRMGTDGKESTYTVNLYQALEKGDVSADMALQKGDVVYVPQSGKKTDWAPSGLIYILSRLIP
jgi:polysaccharide export outer membrane protein